MIRTTIRNSLLMTALGTTALLIAPAEAQRRGLSGEQELARVLKDRVPGRPVNCINLRAINSTRIIAGTAIVYDAGRTLYVNRPRSGADSLDRDDILLTRTTGNQLCSIDTVRLIDRTSRFPSGFVALDRFVPYTRPRGDRR
jgi:hypothetical protein